VSSTASGTTATPLLHSGCEITFLPADPPRTGMFAVYERPGSAPDHSGLLPDEIEVILPAGTGVRRRRVAAALVTVQDALELLRDPDPTRASPSALAWSIALSAGLGLVARGRLYPAVTQDDHDAWRIGPLDVSDRQFLKDLETAFPASAHAVAIGPGSPLRMPSPGALVRQAWDAIADTLPRTAAAPTLSGGACFASVEPQAAGELRPWLEDAAGGIEGGADVALRIELGIEPAGRAVVQLTSRAESSLVMDATELFDAPPVVVRRFGDDAETDLLTALRRGSRAWTPLAPLLRERTPSGLDLDEELLADLLGAGATALQAAGITVLWPKEILSDGIELRASLQPVQGKVVDSGFDLQTLVEFRWQATLDGDVLSEEEIDALADAKRGLVRLRGRWVAADPELIGRMQARRARRLSAIEALGALLAGTVDVDGDRMAVVAEGPLAALAGRLSDLAGAPTTELSPPRGLVAELRPYQSRGVAWLKAMTDAGLGGCLADDMGLGKTVQVIALHLLRADEGRGPTLVICPTSLLGNWEREVRRFAPGIPVRRHHGAERDLDGLASDELVVTSYGVARRDRAALDEAGFTLVVADEAQYAKNPATATARALREIQAPARVALTGTPVENRLSELWSILDWTTPGLLGPLERFVRTVATRIERYQDPVETERLARTVRPFLLRRRKTDPGIAEDLPERIVTDVAVPLSEEQTTLYEAEVREALAAIEGEDGITRQALVLRLLTVLKQICNHPAQYLHEPGPLTGRSGKLRALEDLLAVILSEGESVLIFSQFVECLSLIEARLAQLGIPTLFIHGKISAKGRSAIVDAFQAGEAPVLLLSLKAGGVGLNLTQATHVIHYDRWWNPATEDQATDRAHRIGQLRTVQVHRLVAEGTLEDRIAELIERKRALAEAVVGGGESWLGSLSNSDLAELVSLGGGR
jgi:superfamily II DNA or RNA helicase